MRNFLLIFLMTNRIYVSYSVPNKGLARVSYWDMVMNNSKKSRFSIPSLEKSIYLCKRIQTLLRKYVRFTCKYCS